MPFLLDLAWRDLRRGGRPLLVFAACLMLGVALVAAGGGLYRQVASSLAADVRALFGGDVELRSDAPLASGEVAWAGQRGRLSRVVQLRTMARGDDGRAQLVELWSVDDAYPLAGRLELAPPQPLAAALAHADGAWGVALDGVLARRMGLAIGDAVAIGDATLRVRAIVVQQPDRSLRADWGGAPVLVGAGALADTGLLRPGSRVDYRYRVATPLPPVQWRDAFVAAFPASQVEVRTVSDRSDRIARVLGQIGSGLLLVGISALFIGGLGVFNSVQAYLQGKLSTYATLRALGLRDARLAALVLLQILMLAVAASAIGALAGGALALGGLALAAQSQPVAFAPQALAMPLLAAVAFGVLTALTFALPALGRALAVSPAALFRGTDAGALRTPRAAWLLAALAGAGVLGLAFATLPEPRFALAFLGVAVVLLLLLEAMLRGLRRGAAWLLAHPRWQPGFELRVALSGVRQPGSPLRVSLLSLGSALTLLVACTLVIASLLRTIDETVPRHAPALVFHDVQNDQLATLGAVLRTAPSLERVRTAPLVLGRLAAVNGVPLRDSPDAERRREARDEHKLSDRSGNMDDVVVTRGAWWPEGDRSRPRVAMEDREAEPLGLAIGDTLRFTIQGTSVEVELAAIYAQRRFQSRLWLEAIFSDGALDPFVTRHVGGAWLSAEDAIDVQDRLAAAAPNVASVRTQAVLDAARTLMGRAGAGLAVIAGALLAASLLVLAGVIAASRSRHAYEAGVMHTLGARVSSLARVLRLEYALLALLTAAFAIAAGTALAVVLLEWRLELDAAGLYWTGALTALVVSALSLGAGARVLLAQLRGSPARLLRGGA